LVVKDYVGQKRGENGTPMKLQVAIALMMVLAWTPLGSAQANGPLKLEQSIPLSDVQGRIAAHCESGAD
jgi:hypothetical protein